MNYTVRQPLSIPRNICNKANQQDLLAAYGIEVTDGIKLPRANVLLRAASHGDVWAVNAMTYEGRSREIRGSIVSNDNNRARVLAIAREWVCDQYDCGDITELTTAHGVPEQKFALDGLLFIRRQHRRATA